MEDNREIMVSIRCLVYNHEPYLRQCLDGFVMQKTNFRFEAIVHDDCSTDHSADIIREYAEKYPEIIKPIFESENQFSKHDGTLRKIINAHLRGKYIAMCEGDDYWTDPYKLQMAANLFLRDNNISMVCNRTLLYSERLHKFIGENRICNQDQKLSAHDIIRKGGAYISTCSIIYNKSLLDNIDDKFKSLDYYLQISCAMVGDVFYIDKAMSVYRTGNSESLTGKKYDFKTELLLGYIRGIKMYDRFVDAFPKYKDDFLWKQMVGINYNIPVHGLLDENMSFFYNAFKDYIEKFKLRWKFLFLFQYIKRFRYVQYLIHFLPKF